MPMFLNNVPLSGQTLNQTRVPINGNFQTIDAAFQVDHVQYTSGNQGKHNKVTMPVQAAVPTFAANEVGLYNKVPAAPYPLTTVGELFLHRSDGTETPITASVNNGAGAFQTSGYFYLPSGQLVKYGSFTQATVTGNTHVRVFKTFPTAGNIPAFSVGGIQSVQLSLGNDENPGQAWRAFLTLDRFNSTNLGLSIDINNQAAVGSTGLMLIYYYAIGV